MTRILRNDFDFVSIVSFCKQTKTISDTGKPPRSGGSQVPPNRFVLQDHQDVESDSISPREPNSNRFVLQEIVFFGPDVSVVHDFVSSPPDGPPDRKPNLSDALFAT